MPAYAILFLADITSSFLFKIPKSINNNVNPFTITSGDKTITFKSYKIKKTGLKTPLFSYNYSLFSALDPIRKMTNNADLTIALDGALKPEQIKKIKFFLGQEQL